jgi:hypothetical protein
MLMLGRETNQPADLMFGEGQEKIYSGNDEYETRHSQSFALDL